jgi:purine nucleoside permease
MLFGYELVTLTSRHRYLRRLADNFRSRLLGVRRAPTVVGRLTVAGMLILAGVAAVPRAEAFEPIPIRVVVVTTFELGNDTGDVPGEFQTWVERYPLTGKLPFDQGNRTLRYNQADQVLGIVTGVGKSHAAASIMALGMDPRFDLTKAYWILAGIAGIDPVKGSVGSAVWANYAVDGDLAYEIDGREIPAGWPTGIVPNNRATPYEQPAPKALEIGGEQLFHLNEGLSGWAYHFTADTHLPDDATLKTVRAGYPKYPNAQKPPFVLQGDTLSADRFWVGAKMTEWGRRWVAYWTNGKGTSVTSAEEDTGYLQALTFLAHAKKVDFARVMDLRTASDYELPPQGKTAAQFLASEAHNELSGYKESLESAYLVGSRVVKELAQHWDRYSNKVPAVTVK